ncbi:hypothetical protein Pd630_LPD05056 [Rhodococcus opacus PD630]|nr:hypothetical protein Pd630_LPD05056 [Rhodococcus opacus PD630]
MIASDRRLRTERFAIGDRPPWVLVNGQPVGSATCSYADDCPELSLV